MLLQFPLDILINICRQLDCTDKLNLKTTCHKLNDLITKAVLYEEFNLFHLLKSRYGVKNYSEIKENSNMIVEQLIKDNFDGSCVKVLHLDADYLSEPIVSQLSDLFPNINQIISRQEPFLLEHSTYYQYQRNYKNHPLVKWRESIDTIKTRYDWTAIQGDLMEWEYPRLTELDLGGLERVLVNIVQLEPLSLFNNAPLLTKLTLRDAKINVEVLEEIHDGFPLLTSLRLVRPEMCRDREITFVPPSIPPASKLLYFELLYPTDHVENALVLDYIMKKYTHLQQLVYRVKTDDDYSMLRREDIKRDYYWKDEDYENMVAERLAESKEEFEAYSIVEIQFFSNLPKTLKALTVNTNNIDYAIAGAAKTAGQITMLDLLDCHHDTGNLRIWSDPNILLGFKFLTSLKTLKIAVSAPVQTFTGDFVSLSVTRLVLDVDHDSFYMDWILSMFPNLEELYISSTSEDDDRPFNFNIRGHYYMRITKGKLAKKKHLRLRVLSILMCSIHPDFFDFIKIAVPNLDELTLEIRPLSTLTSSTATEKIDLSSWNLNKCNVSFYNGLALSNIYCIMTLRNTSKTLVYNLENQALLPAYQQRRQKPSSSDVWVEIISDRIKHLKVFGFPVAKVGNDVMVKL